MNDAARLLADIKQSIIELNHCVTAGPNWFTGGEWAQLQHARLWSDKGSAAAAKLEALLGHMLETVL